MTLNLSEAESIATATIAKARAIDAKISVTVCDGEGRLILVKRMDGARSETNRASIGKAIAAAASGRPSEDAAVTINLSLLTGTVVGEGAPISKRQGGLPIFRKGILEGGCGVDGATRDQEDEDCARAGLAALSK